MARREVPIEMRCLFRSSEAVGIQLPSSRTCCVSGNGSDKGRPVPANRLAKWHAYHPTTDDAAMQGGIRATRESALEPGLSVRGLRAFAPPGLRGVPVNRALTRNVMCVDPHRANPNPTELAVTKAGSLTVDWRVLPSRQLSLLWRRI